MKRAQKGISNTEVMLTICVVVAAGTIAMLSGQKGFERKAEHETVELIGSIQYKVHSYFGTVGSTQHLKTMLPKVLQDVPISEQPDSFGVLTYSQVLDPPDPPRPRDPSRPIESIQTPGEPPAPPPQAQHLALQSPLGWIFFREESLFAPYDSWSLTLPPLNVQQCIRMGKALATRFYQLKVNGTVQTQGNMEQLCTREQNGMKLVSNAIVKTAGESSQPRSNYDSPLTRGENFRGIVIDDTKLLTPNVQGDARP